MRFSEVCREIERRSSPELARNGCLATKKALEAIEISNFKYFKKFGGSKTVLVAGTNGKGSAAASLAQLLRAKGFRVGLFTSPHLISICERIQINKENISEDEFVKTYDFVTKKISNIFLTRFEILTVMALHYFSSGELIDPVDYMIFEVGIGGLKDATNAILHSWVMLSTISHDHNELLGSSLKEILIQKLGVTRDKAVKGVVYRTLPIDLEFVRNEYAKSTSAKWIEAKIPKVKNEYINGKLVFYFEWKDQWIELSLVGQRGAEAAVLALNMFQQMGFDPFEVLGEIKNVRWPGRMEFFSVNGKTVFLSGDHNVEGIESLISLLKFYKRKKVIFLVGIAQGKSATQILEKLKLVESSEVVLTKTPYKARESSPDDSLKYLEDSKEAFKFCLNQVGENDVLVVTGSLYLVGEIRSILTGAS